MHAKPFSCCCIILKGRAIHEPIWFWQWGQLFTEHGKGDMRGWGWLRLQMGQRRGRRGRKDRPPMVQRAMARRRARSSLLRGTGCWTSRWLPGMRLGTPANPKSPKPPNLRCSALLAALAAYLGLLAFVALLS